MRCAESFEVLLREHGRRREHGDLFAVHHRLERGANRDLGFAEADVAADQPIHRSADVPCRSWSSMIAVSLVGRFAERKRMLEFALPFGVRAEGVAGLRFALGLDAQAFCRRNRR